MTEIWEIRELLTSSLQLKIDNDFLLADGVNPNTTSIDFYSSTFNAANPAADYTASVQAATIIDLIGFLYSSENSSVLI